MSQLEQLIENSRVNESIANKLFEIETEILASQSSKELLQKLLSLIKEKFNLTGISLLLAEPTSLSFLLSDAMLSDDSLLHAHRMPYIRLANFHSNDKPFLTNNIEQLATSLPPRLLEGAKSAALTPLKLEGKLFGSLLFTDKDENRFSPDLGTIHLEHLAVKVSLCLSNALVREQLEYMANYDRLTGVANRRLMELTITEELVRHQRYNVPFSILFIDCNKFKQINDTYGHDCGDSVLTYVATQLKELIRENDKCFRYAGDEFIVTLASQSLDEAKLAAKRLTEFFIKNPMPYEGETLAITISCGAAASNGEQTMRQLIKEADEQLYKHKNLEFSY